MVQEIKFTLRSILKPFFNKLKSFSKQLFFHLIFFCLSVINPMVKIEGPLKNVKNNSEVSQPTIFYSMNSDLSNVNLDSDKRKIILLDIDDTLYKPSPKLIIHKRKRAKDAFENFKAKDDTFYKWKNEVSAVLKQNEFERLNVSPIVLEKFKNIQYDQFIDKDDRLIEYLKSRNDCRFFCFTNATQFKAEKIINKLGISGLIEGVVCCDDHNQRPILKPMEESYKFVEKLLKINDSNRNLVYFFDDKKENLDFAKGLGWNVGLVDECDYIVDVFNKHKI